MARWWMVSVALVVLVGAAAFYLGTQWHGQGSKPWVPRGDTVVYQARGDNRSFDTEAECERSWQLWHGVSGRGRCAPHTLSELCKNAGGDVTFCVQLHDRETQATR